jgi:hypothetical protein
LSSSSISGACGLGDTGKFCRMAFARIEIDQSRATLPV